MVLSSITTAHATTKNEAYVAGPAGDADGLCRTDPLNPSGLNIGAVCFPVTSAGSGVITITDASTAPVGGYVVAVNSAGAAIGSAVEFCGVSPTFGYSGSAKKIVVYIGGAALGPLACIDAGYPGIGTNGNVKFVY